MDLVTFDRELRVVAGTDAVRPFLCEGSPLVCPVFLVGVNPSTGVPLWPYWSPDRGCDKQGWLAGYRRQQGSLRPTRKRIERLFDTLAPVRGRVTTGCQAPAPREAGGARAKRTTAVFEFLLGRLAPRVVFVHGRSAVAEVARMTGARIGHATFTPARFAGVGFEVFAGHHLAYQWSYAAVDQLGGALRARCLHPATGTPNL